MKEENLHKGHRARMKKQFLDMGIETFEEHQILELLLFFAIPQHDTNEYAHNLINRFGDLHSVFSARYEDLKTVDGIGDNAATLLKLIPELCVKLNAEKRLGTVLDTSESLVEFFKTQFFGVPDEEIKLACFDDRLKLLDIVLINKGDIGSVRLDARKVFQEILRTNCSQIIISHNHPIGNAQPSPADILITKTVQDMIKPMDVTLLDHIVVGTDGVHFILANKFYPHKSKDE